MSFTDKMKNRLLDKSDQYNYYKEHNDKLEKKVAKLEKSLKSKEKQIKKKDKQIKRYRIPYRNFDEFLIESYNHPFIWSPFSDEEKHCLSFMENVAHYLTSKAQNSSEKPLISVIMPVYNREDVVMNAIDSVLGQTYDNFELIVVDDASTDGTGDLLDNINHPKVRIIHHDQNKYASGARNTGFKASKGEIVAYLDSDNLLDERYLAATVGAFLELPDAAGIYSAQYRYTTYDSDPFAVQFSAFNKALLHNHNYIDMNCFAHRRCVMDKINGFDETLKGADDWDLVLQISNNYRIYSVPFLLSKCYVGVVENRVSDLIPTDIGKIRKQNEMLPQNHYILSKKISIVIPVFESSRNLKECLKSILDLKLDNVEIVVSANNPELDLENELGDDSQIKLIQSGEDKGFTHALVQGIDSADSASDILILSPEAFLTEGCLEAMQNHAYELSDCGLVVSTQIVENGSVLKKHVPYAHDDYWCDITPSKFYKNIDRVPIFHNGEVLELKQSPFFCTYLKREVYESTLGFDLKLGKHYHSFALFSDYVRHLLGLKIYHVSDAIVIRNATEEFKNKKPKNEYRYKSKENQWDLDEPHYVWDF